MSYEVYVDVRHHPRHLDEWEQRITDCTRVGWEEGQPWEPIVAGLLRSMADKLDPKDAA